MFRPFVGLHQVVQRAKKKHSLTYTDWPNGILYGVYNMSFWRSPSKWWFHKPLVGLVHL
jgi:hypothetical protein